MTSHQIHRGQLTGEAKVSNLGPIRFSTRLVVPVGTVCRSQTGRRLNGHPGQPTFSNVTEQSLETHCRLRLRVRSPRKT